MSHAQRGSSDAHPVSRLVPDRRRANTWSDRLVWLLTPERLTALPSVWRYGSAVVLVAAATTLRRALIPYLGTGGAYNISALTLVVTTVLFGPGPGLLSVALGDVGVELFVVRLVPAPWDVTTALRMGAAIALGACAVGFLQVIRVLGARSRDSLRRLQALADATFEGLVESEAGRIVDCNPQFAQMVGRTEEELRGMAIADLVAPEDREAVLANISQNVDSVVEHSMICQNGTRLSVLTHGRAVAPGVARRYTAIRDITEIKRAQEDLRRSESQYRAIIETAGEGVVVAQPDGPYMYANQRMADLLGYSVEEIIGKSSMDFAFADERPHVARKREALHRGAVVRGEFRFLRKDGTPVWSAFNATPMFNDWGEHVANVVLHTDVTERKRTEEDSVCDQPAARGVDAGTAGGRDLLGRHVVRAHHR